MSVGSESDRSTAIGFGDALFSGTRQKLLGLLFGQANRSYTLRELIELANAGSGGVQREVERLTRSGLLNAKPVGRQKFYSANRDSPIFNELCALVLKTLGPAERLRAAIDLVGDDIVLAVLFGSVAKGTDSAHSDIDLLLVTDYLTLEKVFKILAPIESELGRSVSPTVYTTREFEKRRRNDHPFLRKVFGGPHTVLKGVSDGTRAT